MAHRNKHRCQPGVSNGRVRNDGKLEIDACRKQNLPAAETRGRIMPQPLEIARFIWLAKFEERKP